MKGPLEIELSIKAVFRSSILGIHSRYCIPARMYYREYILYNVFC